MFEDNKKSFIDNIIPLSENFHKLEYFYITSFEGGEPYNRPDALSINTNSLAEYHNTKTPSILDNAFAPFADSLGVIQPLNNYITKSIISKEIVPGQNVPEGEGLAPLLVLNLLKIERYDDLRQIAQNLRKQFGALPEPEKSQGLCPLMVIRAVEAYADLKYRGKSKEEALATFTNIKALADEKLEEARFKLKIEKQNLDPDLQRSLSSLMKLSPTTSDERLFSPKVTYSCDAHEGIDPQTVIDALDKDSARDLLSFANKVYGRYGPVMDINSAEGVCPLLVIDSLNSYLSVIQKGTDAEKIRDELRLFAESKQAYDMNVSMALEMLEPFTPS